MTAAPGQLPACSLAPTDATACPVCGDVVVYALSARDENRAIDDTWWAYGRCQGCRLMRLMNVPADLGTYYPADYQSLPDRSRLEQVARKDRYKLGFLDAAQPGGRVVDIGASVGAFALSAQNAGFAVTAVEMDVDCVRHLEETVGVAAIGSDRPEQVLRELPPSAAITLWHVLEHLADPFAVIEAAATNLQPGGVLVVATPNPGARQFSIMGARWPHIDAPRHLWLIPAAVLLRLGERHGLRPVLLTSSDPGGRRWNRFGWQRLLMNRARRRPVRAAGFFAGVGLGAAVAPLERGHLRGACYTAVLQKAPA